MTGPIYQPVYLGPGDWSMSKFYDVRECEFCGDLRPLRVWALPGFPMSCGGCFQCWYMDCLPLWLVENFGDPELFGPDWRNDVADYVLDSHVFKDGAYVRIRDLP